MWNERGDLLERRDRLLGDDLEDLPEAVGLRRTHARQALVHHHPERPDVGAMIDVFLAEDLHL